MKKIYILYIAVALSTMATSCKKGFLDQVPDDRLTVDDIFLHRNTTEEFLANVYSQIPDDSYQRFASGYNAGPWTAGADEAKYAWDFVITNSLNLGSWGPSSGFVGDYWTNYYQGIRNAGYFIAHVDQCTELGTALITQYKAEARALRAIYYYFLVRTYGPVVLTGDNPISPDASFEDVQLPRSSFEECSNYIVSELDEANKGLLKSNTNNDVYGRITAPVAQAYKLQMLLLAASPLFNGNTDYADLKNEDGKQLISQTSDATKWKTASDAYKAFITAYVPSMFDLYTENDANGKFNAYLSCRDVMLTQWGVGGNKEWIYARPSATMTYEYDKTPFHAGAASQVKGGGALSVTQGQVDAFFMSNGRSITDPESGYQETGFSSYQAPFDVQARSTFNQWVNREPRFYVDVTYNNSLWLNTNYGNIVTNMENSGNSGLKGTGSDHSATGYVVRKDLSVGSWTSVSRAFCMLRLAKIYLDYAEALNEAVPGDADILKYVNLIRARAGVPQYGNGTDALPIPTGQDAVREVIRKERRVELAFENVRYFDTRRWKIAEQTDAGAVYALNISADGDAFYNKVILENRIFTKKHYLFPIPQSEINLDKQLVQNTGWQ